MFEDIEQYEMESNTIKGSDLWDFKKEKEIGIEWK